LPVSAAFAPRRHCTVSVKPPERLRPSELAVTLMLTAAGLVPSVVAEEGETVQVAVVGAPEHAGATA
jgi:hypothetical protein